MSEQSGTAKSVGRNSFVATEGEAATGTVRPPPVGILSAHLAFLFLAINAISPVRPQRNERRPSAIEPPLPIPFPARAAHTSGAIASRERPRSRSGLSQAILHDGLTAFFGARFGKLRHVDAAPSGVDEGIDHAVVVLPPQLADQEQDQLDRMPGAVDLRNDGVMRPIELPVQRRGRPNVYSRLKWLIGSMP